MLLLLLLVIILVFSFALGYRECPREILGYHCKGDACDHSKQAIAMAKHARGWYD